MDRGNAVEYDVPFLLLVENENDTRITKKDGVFAKMVLDSGEAMSRRIFEIARKTYFENIKGQN